MNPNNPKSKIKNRKSQGMLQDALKLHQTGNLAEAAVIYNKILEKQPNNIDAISLLGTLYLQTENPDAACVFLRTALALKPDNATVHNNLGSALQASGRFAEAIASYNQAITLKPDYEEAYYNLGNALQAIGRTDEAIACYNQAIILKPNDADIHNNLANALRKNGKPDEALKSYKQAEILKPHNVEILCNLGAAFQELGNLDEAILNYKKAITLKPNHAKAHNNLGTALKKQCRLEEAVKNHKRAIELKPDYAEAYNNLGSTLQSLNRLDEAIESYRKAISLKSDYAEAHYNFGNVLKEQKKFDEAFASYKRAITIKPDYAEAHNNLGITLQEQGKFAEAVANYSHAIELKSDYADAHFNRSLMSLLKGNFKDGWQEYEWRLRTKDYALRAFPQPMWNGSPLNGKTILVHTEQGLGDNIQFVRYLPMVQEQGGQVIFECLPSLIRLLKNCAGIDKIIERKSDNGSSAQFDVQIPLLSLPGIFNTTLDNIPSGEPYITPDPTLVTKWKNQLGYNDKSFKIGLVWASNPENKGIYLKKSCKLNDFEDISKISGLSFYSLQKGQASAEANNPPHGMKIVNLSNELSDLSETAAVIANLDLVISIDTVVAHLAGAIGKPVWTLLPFVPDWRWLLDRNDSPWYPGPHQNDVGLAGMRLFRQTQINDWDGVFKQVKETLISNLGLRSKKHSAIRNPESKIQNPTISLCMIVKNEEHNLPRCLDSVENLVDEIIIVDTGSTDKTVEIAKSYGANVFNHPWEGSFSKARNYSLKYATCDWILILDADEELRNGDSKLLKKITRNNGYSVVSFIIQNKYKNSTLEGYASMVRFFKNFSGIYYEGIVHNSIRYNSKCFYSPITIIHHGYNLSEEKMNEKFLRTSTLLMKQIESDPNNPVLYRYIGISYMDRKMFDDAITSSKKAISLAEERGFNINDFIDSYYIVSSAYFEKKEFKNSEAYAIRSVELDNQFLDGYCVLSFAYYNLKEHAKFIKASENYLAIYNKITYSASTNALTSLHTPFEKERKGRLEAEAQTNFIYHTIGHKWKIHLLRGLYYLSNNQEDKGNFEIDIATKESTDMEECLLLLGNFYLENSNIDKAEDAYKRLLDINEKSVNTLFKLGRISFLKGDLKETLFFWSKAVEIDPASLDIRLLICKINIVQGNIEDVVADCDRLLQILNMPRNLTIECLDDLANLFGLISERLKEIDDVQSAETASRICDDLEQISKNELIHHGNA